MAERHEATYREIVAAAVHAFRVRGYTATTMSTVAAIAGVSPRTLYRYFGSKSGLFAATAEEVNAEFLQQLSERIETSSIHDAIIGAVENAYRELNGESREMMRLTAADQNAWRYFLGAASKMQPTVAAALRSAAGRYEGGDCTDEQLAWDVRASALLGAISTAYRRWATSPSSELPDLIAAAVEVVLPAVATRPTPNNADNGDSITD
jgi:AcrR family transcriptional regulator